MRLPFPRSLSGQTLAVLSLTLLISHLIGITVYSRDRREAVITTEAHDFAERVVGMVNLLRHLPAEWREAVVRESDGRTFHVSLQARPNGARPDLDEDLSGAVARYLADQLPGWSADRLLVSFTETPVLARGEAAKDRPSPSPAGDGDGPSLFMHVSVLLGEDGWLNFVVGMPGAKSIWLMPASAYILSIALGVGIAAVWLVFRFTAPLAAFARAADRLGRDLRAEPLAETGPIEVAQAAHAFNAMQERLRRLVENRTQILAALSHDLKTPVTLLRLRAELMDDSEERAKILDTLDEMEAMIASVLEFTKATLLNEPQRMVDLPALLGSICEDMADAGAAAELVSADKISYACRPVGLKRALRNLIDNAVKYGGAARVRIARRDGTVDIEIDDDGPGIPADRQAEVFMPFYRIDESRSEAGGGVGLGLSIAQAIIHGHGGRIGLENRPEGGLRVRVSLPL